MILVQMSKANPCIAGSKQGNNPKQIGHKTRLS